MKIDSFTLAFIYLTIVSIILGGVSALGSVLIYEALPFKKRMLAVLLPVFLLMYYITIMADLELPFWYLFTATTPPFLISFGLFFNILHRWLSRLEEKQKERKAE